MTHIPAIGQDRATNSSATYNAVKIQINNPKTNLPEDFCPKCEDNNNYNAVNIEVNDPSIEAQKKSVYDYPESKDLVTYDQAFAKPKQLPPLPLPLAYQIINNRTFVNAEIELEQAEKQVAEAQPEIETETEEVVVPEENFTTTEEQKAEPENEIAFHCSPEEATEETENNTVAFRGEDEAPVTDKIAFRGENEEPATNEVSFRGEAEEPVTDKVAFRGENEEPASSEVSFRGETEEPVTDKVAFRGEDEAAEAGNVNFKAAQAVEIIPPVEIKPEVDINSVVEKLNDADYDVQAKQIYEIVTEAKADPQKAENYVVTDVFTSLTDIVTKDVTDLNRPDDKINDVRKKYIVNEIVKEQARLNGEDADKVELPYEISDDEIAAAVKLTDFEMAERNKDYAITALAVLAKTYADGVEEKTGNTVPLTDLPGVSACVDTLRYGSNPDVKVKAIEALMYINRPEYSEELKSVFELSAKDQDPAVAMISTAAVQYLNEGIKG